MVIGFQLRLYQLTRISIGRLVGPQNTGPSNSRISFNRVEPFSNGKAERYHDHLDAYNMNLKFSKIFENRKYFENPKNSNCLIVQRWSVLQPRSVPWMRHCPLNGSSEHLRSEIFI